MKKSILAIAMALVLILTGLTGCGQAASQAASTGKDAKLASAGVLVLKVNPEIAIEYDEKGAVTAITARNGDAMAIIDGCEDLIGQETRAVVTKLVTAIGKAGYFVEEVEGEHRQITLEIETGSMLPHDKFLDEIISDVRDSVKTNKWDVPIDVENDDDDDDDDMDDVNDDDDDDDDMDDVDDNDDDDDDDDMDDVDDDDDDDMDDVDDDDDDDDDDMDDVDDDDDDDMDDVDDDDDDDDDDMDDVDDDDDDDDD